MEKFHPRALQGIHIGKDGIPNLRLECVCDLDLYIWHLSFGYPGVMNDLNILNLSRLFSKVLAGTFPPVKALYTIGDQEFDWVYFLTDGIYPKWRTFVQSLSSPTGSSQTRFASKQEYVRKCVECVFVVLFARFRILCTPSRLWDNGDMAEIMSACAILYNMIVVERKDGYSRDGAGGMRRARPAGENLIDAAATCSKALQLLAPAEIYDFWRRLERNAVAEETKNREQHDALVAALVEQF
jgi:Plant transposon protein